jgi:hypothetical protein
MNNRYIELQELVKNLQNECQEKSKQLIDLKSINSKLKDENSNLISTNKSLTDNLQ